MKTADALVDRDWADIAKFLPENLDEIAFTTKALVRNRNVDDAFHLVRALLVYSQVGSFRTAAAVLRGSGIMEITAEGLFSRLKNAEKFLEEVLESLTAQFRRPRGSRLLIADSTCLSGPGAKFGNFRIHTTFDPDEAVPVSFYVANHKVGESMALHEIGPGCLVLADLNYGRARSIHAALARGSDILIRVQAACLRLLDSRGARVKWDELSRQLPESGYREFEFIMPVPGNKPGCKDTWHERDAVAWHRLRVIGSRASKRGEIWWVTNLPESRLPVSTISHCYRTRWQIELYFKRLKSLGTLDTLRSREGPTAKASILAKLISLTLASLLSQSEKDFSPCDQGNAAKEQEPVEGIPDCGAECRQGLHAKEGAKPKEQLALFLETEESGLRA